MVSKTPEKFTSTTISKRTMNKLKITKEIKKELDHLHKSGIPRCPNPHCHKNFKNGYDSIEKKMSKYLWIPDCKCYKKPIGICIG